MKGKEIVSRLPFAETVDLLRKAVEENGLKFYLRARVSRVSKSAKGKSIHIITHKGQEIVEAEELIVATRRMGICGSWL